LAGFRSSGEADSGVSGGGRIVHITLTVVSTTLPGYAADSLNKAAVETSTKIVAKEVAEEKTE
jgi:enoyl-[acyl-carrier-protein] reductase (NADH)